MKRILYSSLALLLVLIACSKDEEPVPPPTPKFSITITAGDGGSVSTSGGTYDKGTKVTITATPDGEFLFDKWSDGNTDNPREITVSSNLNLSASFIKKKYALIVNVEGEGTVEEDIIVQGSTSTTEYNSGTTIKLTATPSDEWVFSGWSGTIESNDNPIEVTVDEAKEITATFKLKQYELTINIEGEGTVSETIVTQPTLYDSATAVQLEAIPSDGWIFSGWSGAIESTDNPVEISMDAAKEITGSFVLVNPNQGLQKESYLNQRSGIFFSWGYGEDYHPNLIPPAQWYAGGQGYYDVNRDGYQDILVTRHFDDYAVTGWHINRGDNKNFDYNESFILDSTNGLSSYKILKTDVNNDGLADFILLGVDETEPGNYGGNFTVLLQNESFYFNVINIDDGKGLWYHTGAAGDLNGDGNVDVLGATYIWWGDGNGYFEQHPNSLEMYINSPLTYEIMDINKDGYNDLILRGPYQNTTIVLNNNGVFDENNQKIIMPDASFKAVMDIEIIDVDNDGDLDIVEMAQKGGNPPDDNNPIYFESKCMVYLNDNLNFTVNENFYPGTLDGNLRYGNNDRFGWSRFKFDDIDNDGIDDIISENYQDGEYNGAKFINGEWVNWKFKF